MAEHVHIIGFSTRALKNTDTHISFFPLHFFVHFYCIYEAIAYITDCGIRSLEPVLKVKELKSN